MAADWATMPCPIVRRRYAFEAQGCSAAARSRSVALPLLVRGGCLRERWRLARCCGKA
jgi:hypothetical protein